LERLGFLFYIDDLTKDALLSHATPFPQSGYRLLTWPMARSNVGCCSMAHNASESKTDWRRRSVAIAQMLTVVLVWSSSFVGVKVALRYTGPLTVAAYRYFLAFVFLLPWLFLQQGSYPKLKRSQWLRFGLMGIAQYTIGNGVLYIAMKTLSATTGSLALCF